MQLRRLLSAALVVAALAPVGAARATMGPCSDVSLIWVRGSGASLNDTEGTKFFTDLTDRLGGVSLNKYEVGTEPHGGAQYPATDIGSFTNLLEAEFSAAGVLGGQYRASVTQGDIELDSYVRERIVQCPSELFVIGAHSQGAQVVGDVLASWSTSILDRIAFVPLFGDPRLYLPEGRGPFPPACWGSDFSPWRRGNVSCFTDGGILDPRKPYLPASIETRVGSWCDRNDYVCNGNLSDALWSAHSHYADAGGEMDEAMAETADKLRAYLPAHASTIDGTVIHLATGADGIQVAFVVDTTGSMSGRLASAKAVVDSVAQEVVNANGQIGLIEYKDAGDVFANRVGSLFTTDITYFDQRLNELYADGGGDTPEALLSALMLSFQALDWQAGKTKAVVILTDAGYHDPDLVDGTTFDQVVNRALEIDPVNAYPVVPSYLDPTQYQNLATATAGKLIVDSGDTAGAITAAFDEVTSRPVVTLDFDKYLAPAGQAITFRADAYDTDSTITSYEWDFDANGTIDQTTTTPTVTHAYAAGFDGMVEVRAHSADGGIGSASATVTVSATGVTGLVPGQPTSLTAVSSNVSGSTRDVTLSWQPPTGGGTVVGYRVMDATGETIGLRDAATRSGIVRGVANTATSFSVVAVNEYGDSTPATVSVPAVQSLTVTGLAPSGGVVAGGTTVTVTGTGFASGATVKFGANAATNVVVNSSTSLTARSPAGAAGFVYVTVTTAAGTSPASAASQFLYGSVPTVKSINPKSIASNSSTTLTVSGTNFVPGYTKVSVNGFDPATDGRVPATITPTSLTLAITSGCYRSDFVVDVRVWTPVGTSATSTATKFTYKQSQQSCIVPPPRE